MRLQKYLALCGLGSRRKMEEEIGKGHVKVNGQVVTAMGIQIDPERDRIAYLGKTVKPEEKKIYLLLYKPVGVVTTAKDEKNRKTVLDLLDIPERVYPVGRLDYDTSGLLLLTNDGDFAYAMTHPKHQIPKTYVARVDGLVREEELEPLRKGIQVEGITYAPAWVCLRKHFEEQTELEIIIKEGRNRQVRKMCQGIGHPVRKLERISLGPLVLGSLKPGQWRILKSEEVKKLKEWNHGSN